MHGWVPPRLRPFLGADLSSLDEERLRALIGMGEETDLEFKQEPWATTEGGSKECAVDVADKANAGGALIIIGAVEDADGRLADLVPVAPADTDLALRIDQVIASRISPAPAVSHHRLPISGGEVHIISIAPSLRPPHGVAVGGDALRYPVRAGKTRRFLSEPEIADWYQRRLTALSNSTALLDDLRAAARRLIPAKPEDSDPWSWIVVAAMPDFPGNLNLRRGLTEEYNEWLGTATGQFPGFRRSGAPRTSPTFRALAVHDEYNPASPIYAFGGELRMDGSGFLIAGHLGGRNSPGSIPDTSMIYDEHVLADLVNLVSILARHASTTGAVGNLNVAAELTSALPMLLGQYRGTFAGQFDGTRPVEATTGFSIHAASADDLVQPSPELLSVARLLMGDLVSAFGLPEPQQITVDGELVMNRFYRDHQPHVERWAQRAGVPTIPTWPT